jgi:hypothetical protein
MERVCNHTTQFNYYRDAISLCDWIHGEGEGKERSYFVSETVAVCVSGRLSGFIPCERLDPVPAFRLRNITSVEQQIGSEQTDRIWLTSGM